MRLINEKRRKYYVSRDIQKAFILFISIEIALITIFFLIALYLNQSMYSNLLIQYGNPPSEIIKQSFLVKKFLIIIFGVLLCGNIALIAYGSLFFSHKIAGPLFRLQRILKEIRESNNVPDGFKMRSADLPKALTEEIHNFFLCLEEQKNLTKWRRKFNFLSR